MIVESKRYSGLILHCTAVSLNVIDHPFSDRVASQDHDTVDLHGTTVSEAIEIAKETLKQQNCSPGNATVEYRILNFVTNL